MKMTCPQYIYKFVYVYVLISGFVYVLDFTYVYVFHYVMFTCLFTYTRSYPGSFTF